MAPEKLVDALSSVMHQMAKPQVMIAAMSDDTQFILMPMIVLPQLMNLHEPHAPRASRPGWT